MTTPPYSWMNPELEIRDTGRYGLGVFAKATIPKGETLFVCGGAILTLEDEDNLPPECADKPIEISEWFSMGPRTLAEIPLMPQHYVNHSCDPNAGWKGQLFIVAMRDIRAGEEICYDYPMVMHNNADSASYWTMPCCCGSPLCRGQVAEDDWMRPELQARYDGWFAWHLQRKIDQAKAESHATSFFGGGWGGDVIPPDGRISGFHWMDVRVTPGTSRFSGRGCFAMERIPAGAPVFAFGGYAMKIDEEVGVFGFQIAQHFVIGPLPGEESDADFVNHSCEPNLGFLGQVFLVTLRDIAPGEELCFDYAMCLGGDIPCAMPCRCGSQNCRGKITHLDWRDRALQRKYAEHFQWYLQDKINAKRAMPAKAYPTNDKAP